jgi:membrane fusion protein (multidrug efflux system)
MSEVRKPNKRKVIMVAGIFFLFVGLAGGGWWWYQSTKVVNTDDARVSGTIVSVSPKNSGRIAEV